MKDIQLKPEKSEWGAGWNRFWFSPADPVGLHTFRVLTGLVLLAWLLPFAGNQQALFGLAGWVDSTFLQALYDLERSRPLEDRARLPLSWSVFYIAGDNGALVDILYWLSIATILAFTFGFAVRLTAVLTWVFAASYMANPTITFDADYLLVLPPFYLMLGYLFYGQYSRDLKPADRILGPRDAWLTQMFSRPEAPSHAANFAVRLFQIHFAIVVLTSALHKLQMPEWWGGVAFFYPLHPPYETVLDHLRVLQPQRESYFFFISLGGYLMLAWQLAFPAFAWRKGCRWLLIGGGVVGWLGCIFLFYLPMFGPIYLLGCLSYLTPEEWRSVLSRLRSFFPGAKTEEPHPALKGPKLAKEQGRRESASGIMPMK